MCVEYDPRFFGKEDQILWNIMGRVMLCLEIERLGDVRKIHRWSRHIRNVKTHVFLIGQPRNETDFGRTDEKTHLL